MEHDPDRDAEQHPPPADHDKISPVDLPPDHPGRKQAEHDADGPEGETPGNT